MIQSFFMGQAGRILIFRVNTVFDWAVKSSIIKMLLHQLRHFIVFRICTLHRASIVVSICPFVAFKTFFAKQLLALVALSGIFYDFKADHA